MLQSYLYCLDNRLDKERLEVKMISPYRNVLNEEQLVKVVRKLAYELSQKEEMLKVMRWMVDLESEKQTRRLCHEKKIK